jgi:hypothetical protein
MTEQTGRKLPTRVVVLVGIAVALLLAGVVSFYASGSPDGLERVAEEHGLTAAQKEHAAADGPMADYQTRGVDDERISVGLAGIVGSLLVLVVAGGLAYVVRRRDGGASESSESAEQAEQSKALTASDES